MKKLLSIFLSLSLFVSVLGICDVSFASQTSDIAPTRLGDTNTYYSYDFASKTLKISGQGRTPDFTNSSGSSSSQPWFFYRDDGSIEHIVVEQGVTYIGSYFFYSTSCTDISLADSIESIGGYAFADSKIKNITLDKNLKYISSYAFYFCDKLTDITIPKSVLSIGTSAFENCTSLSKVTFEAMGAQGSVSQRAFFKCPSLKRVDIPSGFKLSPYSFGYKSASVDGTYDGFTLGVFSGSKAYDYAKGHYIDYVLLNEIEINEGDSALRTYTSDNLTQEMIYKFTPKTATQYTFSSSGDVDVNCVLKDGDGNTLIESDDNSESDLNFTIKYTFEADKVYYFYVTSVNSLGDYTVSLSSERIVGISISWDKTYQAQEIKDVNFSVLEYIKTQTIDFEYASGYVYKMPFNNGATYRGMKITYNNLLNGKVTCGENKDSITVGDKTLDFTITVNHSFDKEVIEPTVSEYGYTVYTCTYCGYTYRGDYVDYLGQDIYGHVYLMSGTDGTIDENRALEGVSVYDKDGKYLTKTDKDGYFYVEYAYDCVVLKSNFTLERKIKITKDEAYVGKIGLICGDLTGDGYINAKDYGIFVHLKKYDINDSNNVFLKNLDSNKDGVLTDDDWAFAKEFYTFSKLGEDTYREILQ